MQSINYDYHACRSGAKGMQYYSMCHEWVEGSYTSASVAFSPSLDTYYDVGQYVQLEGLSVTAVMDKNIRRLKSDVFLAGPGAFFVSEALKQVVSALGHDLHFVKADVRYANGSAVEKRYFLAHAQRLQACLDYERSDYSGKPLILRRIQENELEPGYKVRGIKKLCIDAARTDGLDIFFLDKAVWIDPIVSKALVHAVEQEKLLVRFVPL
jgi:hypothetical protein